MGKVVIVIKWISHYRIAFYEALRQRLSSRGVDLVLIYGEPINDSDRKKKDWVDISWGTKVPNISIGKYLIWQPVLSYLKDADLVIVEHANKLLLNYFLQVKMKFGRQNQKLAFWGHGKNYQSSENFLSFLKEKWKIALMHNVDWWFAYNELCALDIGCRGFPKSKITCVENAVDTTEIKNISTDISDEEIFSLKQTLQISGANIAVFCGGMFHEKRLPFLLESAIEVRKKIPDFEILFIGAGIDQGCVEDAARVYPWIHYLGPLFGRDKVLAMKISHVYLMPGLIGLGVLDAFALGLPVVTTDFEFHSPEISYVRNKVNGIITNNDLKSFSDGIAEIFLNRDLRFTLKAGCEEASKKYTIENMAINFSNGVVKCLSS